MKFFQINDKHNQTDYLPLLRDNRRLLYDLEKNLRINLQLELHIQKEKTVINKYRRLYHDLETVLANKLSWRVYVYSLNKISLYIHH